AAGARGVLLKGGHLEDGADDVMDLFAGADGMLREFSHPRLPRDAHGTGCTLAAAIAANLCRGLAPADACEAATGYVHRALRGSYSPGRGDVLVLDHFGAARPA
ncbi:MAG: bifunctional hydroxymethylpyrimidine kinase/phosphomethylpyrimidine kinase, partial [Gammaproteobacteria bacterium]|nr:bifunctional hydroxymethylpyrimidine kinase/phosphomethylpyrimidine kinase [Gammaproteobacteria bacterium]